ncbi:hypothetical protein [Halorhabdus amylolytica]|uniref:hypothetical protein n=1 Tax=Halorhabdus amylolytica TaxID=2559573 RepID=UPI0010AA117D|nr:hypothetical protein [Halorhabdus amylolytica]
MSDRKWTPGYVQQRFPAEVRELRRADGKDPDVKPTHQWLRDHGLSGIQGYAERQEKTVDEVLLDECGFEPRERKPLPGTHAETKQLIHKWLQDEDEEFNRLNDTSVGNAWTHMRRLMEISREALGSTNLLRPARAPAGKNVRLTLDLFREMNGELEAEGARYNYASTLASFYEYLEMIGEVDSNPAEKVLPRMGWSYNRESPEQTLTPAQVRECWEATRSIDDGALEDPDAEGLRELLVEKVLLLCLAGCGHRTSDPLITNAQEDVILDQGDPRVCFDAKRKNGPGTTPIMAGLDYFEQYIELLKETGHEMLFPSELSEDGTRSDAWVRNKIEEIVDRADVRLPDGSKPTPKHFRQFWFNEYLDAYEAYIAKIEDVAEAQSSASAEIVDKHYLASHRARDHFRRFAYEHFETAFPTDVVVAPEEIAAARDTDTDEDGQSSLEDFVGAWLPGVAHAWVSAQLAKARAQREKAAIEYDPETSLPSRREAVVVAAGTLVSATMIGVMTAHLRVNPIVDPGSVPPEMSIALVAWLAYAIYDMPDLEEPPANSPS